LGAHPGRFRRWFNKGTIVIDNGPFLIGVAERSSAPVLLASRSPHPPYRRGSAWWAAAVMWRDFRIEGK
jgi:hypothetical protein